MKRAVEEGKKLPWKLDNYNYRWSKTYASTDDCIQWFNAVISWYYCWGIIVTLAILCLCSTTCSSSLLCSFHFHSRFLFAFSIFIYYRCCGRFYFFTSSYFVLHRVASPRTFSLDIFSKFMRGQSWQRSTENYDDGENYAWIKKLFRVRLPCAVDLVKHIIMADDRAKQAPVA